MAMSHGLRNIALHQTYLTLEGMISSSGQIRRDRCRAARSTSLASVRHRRGGCTASA